MWFIDVLVRKNHCRKCKGVIPAGEKHLVWHERTSRGWWSNIRFCKLNCAREKIDMERKELNELMIELYG